MELLAKAYQYKLKRDSALLVHVFVKGNIRAFSSAVDEDVASLDTGSSAIPGYLLPYLVNKNSQQATLASTWAPRVV